jgi:phosphohistidine phosphatase
MQLFLLRHAEAEADAPTDAKRVLSEKGSKQAESIGRFCLAHGLIPEMILSSPVTRADETGRLVARELNLPKIVRIVEFLRIGMTVERAFSGLRECMIDLMKREKYSEKVSIMLVGHEPDFK